MENLLKDFINKYSLKTTQSSGRSYIFDCPVCGGKKKLYVQKKDGRSVCFKQGASECPKPGSKAPYAMSLLAGISYAESKKFFFDENIQISDGDDLPPMDLIFEDDLEPEQKLEPIGIDKLPDDAIPHFMPGFTPGKQYLNNRGITDEIISKYGIMYWISKRRVIFNVEMHKKLYGWQGRAIDPVDKGFRMYNLPGPWKTKTLMFYDNIHQKDFAILAEGPISALKFYKVGHFVASMGKEISKTQIQLLIDSGIKRLYLALDRDAYDKNDYLYQIMNDYNIETFLIKIPNHRDDFGDCTLEECEAQFKSAEKYVDSLNSGDWFVKI